MVQKFIPTPEQLEVIRRAEELAAKAIGSAHHAPPGLVHRMTEEGRLFQVEEVEVEGEGDNAPCDDA